MKSLFIKGTNKQYSIRDDGQVIIHYIRTRYNSIILHKEIVFIKQDKTKAVVIFINNKRIKRTSVSLLKEYYNKFLCKDCNIYHKKGKDKSVICNKCYNKRRKLSKKKSLIKTKEFQLSKGFYKRLFLDDNIISTALNVSINILSPEIITAKRQQLLLHRQLKTIKL